MTRPLEITGSAHKAIGLLAAVGCLSTSVRASTLQTPRAPNIILIVADDLGYGDLVCYGQQKIRTPNIDRLAAGGMRFAQAYAGAGVCAPSRCCLMTGMSSGHSRIRGNGGFSRVWRSRSPQTLLPEDVTIAKLLRDKGYATAAFGKWGLGAPGTLGTPNRQGFDEWLGYLSQQHAHDYYPSYLWRNGEKTRLEENQNGRKGLYSHDLFTAEALDFVRRHRRQPFFLYLPYTIPHINNELHAETGNGMETPDEGEYAGKPWPQMQKNYAAMVSRMDRDIGRLVELLKELAIDKNTVVFFTSDNGPMPTNAIRGFFCSTGDLRGGKASLYEGGLRIPLIAWWPGNIEAGAVSNHVCAFWDFLPTVAELAGVEPPRNIDGVSFAPELLGKKQPRHEYLYWEHHGSGRLGGFARALRIDHWKAVQRSVGGPIELYDLSSDTGETRDIAASNPDVVARATSILEGARTYSAEWPVRDIHRRDLYLLGITALAALGSVGVALMRWNASARPHRPKSLRVVAVGKPRDWLSTVAARLRHQPGTGPGRAAA